MTIRADRPSPLGAKEPDKEPFAISIRAAPKEIGRWLDAYVPFAGSTHVISRDEIGFEAELRGVSFGGLSRVRLSGAYQASGESLQISVRSRLWSRKLVVAGIVAAGLWIDAGHALVTGVRLLGKPDQEPFPWIFAILAGIFAVIVTGLVLSGLRESKQLRRAFLSDLGHAFSRV